MRVLLDTNILIHREAATVVREDIGVLFNWLDRLRHEKIVHPASIAEIQGHHDPKVKKAFEIKLSSYTQLQTTIPRTPEVEALSKELDRSVNDENDTLLLNEVVADRVDWLITEDRGIARKASRLAVSHRVFTIDEFLEKVTSENPELSDYKVLAVEKTVFGSVPIKSPFFDSFREDYPGFDKWFMRKCDEPVYICKEGDDLVAFLFLKVENADEPYPDIQPPLPRKRRLKIGTFKVELNGFKLGERFLKIVFDNAIRQSVDEVYVTIFPKSIGQIRLIRLLQEFGFVKHGVKDGAGGTEDVYVRNMAPHFLAADPKLSFPYFSRKSRSFLVPIYPDYHTSLLPDSILNNESPTDFVEQEPYRNAIKKVYVSRGYFRDLHRGDNIVFYRTGGHYKSVVTTIGIVDGVYRNPASEDEFLELCRKRSVFTDDELREQWRYRKNSRPFVVGFLYAYSFPRRPNLHTLIEHGVIANVDSAPRGFEQITQDQLLTILSLSETDPRIVVD